MGKIQIEETEHTRLVETAGQVDDLTTQLADAETALAEALAKIPEEPKGPKGPRTSHQQVMERLDTQKHEMDVLRARESARDIIAEEMTEAWVAPSTVARLTTELLANLPLAENGSLDETALRDSCVEARDRAELEAAETLDAAGVGAPRGLGASTPPAGGEATKYTDSITESLGEAFGLSEAESKTAVKGR
jgi:hypothetical protein